MLISCAKDLKDLSDDEPPQGSVGVPDDEVLQVAARTILFRSLLLFCTFHFVINISVDPPKVIKFMQTSF
jgi:hypothetical protein